MVIDRSERVDVRIPEKTYKKIERIAEKTNQPFTPKSKNTKNPKRVVTPIILELLELGLSVYGKKQLELNETEFEDVNLTTLENKILSRLEVTIKDLVTQQVSEAILQYEHMSKVFDEIDLELAVNQLSELTRADNEEINEIIEDTSEIINEDVSALEDVSESVKSIDNSELVNEDNSENETNETIEDNFEPNLLPKEVESEDTSPEIKENTEDKEQGLSMGKLAERFETNKNEGKGASKTTISSKLKKLSKEEFINWSKENDPENKGWYLGADNKFYSVD